MKKDLEKFGRDIRRKMHDLDEPTPKYHHPGHHWFDKYLSELEKEILKINEAGQNYPNLTKAERQALQDLVYDKNIVFEPADKGIAIVIWEKNRITWKNVSYS